MQITIAKGLCDPYFGSDNLDPDFGSRIRNFGLRISRIHWEACQKPTPPKNKAKNVFNLPLFFLEPLLAAVFFELSALFSLDSLARSAGAGLSEDKTPETPPALSPLTELVSEPVLDVEVEAFLDSGCQRAGKVDHQVHPLI